MRRKVRPSTSLLFAVREDMRHISDRPTMELLPLLRKYACLVRRNVRVRSSKSAGKDMSNVETWALSFPNMKKCIEYPKRVCWSKHVRAVKTYAHSHAFSGSFDIVLRVSRTTAPEVYAAGMY